MQIKRIAILVFPGVEELDFVGVYEVLAKLKQIKEDDSPEVRTIGIAREITCALGLKVSPHELYQGFGGYDLLIIPGGRGIKEVITNRELLKAVKEFSQDHIVCSVCTGALILGAAGILEGRKATTHHLHKDELKKYCEVVEDRVIQDGNVITAAGVSAALDLGLKIVELACGQEVSRQLAERIEYWRSAGPSPMGSLGTRRQSIRRPSGSLKKKPESKARSKD